MKRMKTLVILAGGKSSRMGQDKVLLKLDGMTFIERIFRNAQPYFGRIIISTDSIRHADAIKSLPFFSEGLCSVAPEFVTDIYSEAGPMGGILSVFEKTDAPRFSVISVDVPFADAEVLAGLYDHCVKKACCLRLPGRRSEPLIAAYDRAAYDDIKSAFEKGIYKMRAALRPEDTDILTDDTPQAAAAFRNFNTPGELAGLLS